MLNCQRKLEIDYRDSMVITNFQDVLNSGKSENIVSIIQIYTTFDFASLFFE